LKDLGLVLWTWLSFVANGGYGLRYGGVVVGLLGFFGFGLWLAEVVVMADRRLDNG